MSAAVGAAFARPLCSGTDHVKALLFAAASVSSPSSRSSSGLSRKGNTPSPPSSSTWPQHRQGIPVRYKVDGFGFLGQHDGIGPFADVCKYFPRAPEQPYYPSRVPRSRVREGGADSESKGSNHSSDSRKSNLKKELSLLLSLVQEIQPLDATQIGKEVSPDSTDAMKRTISGMLGLLPSDQFHVWIETSGEPLAKLLVSSMMTGYTLRNAEYRLCLQKSLEFSGNDKVGDEGKELAELEVLPGVSGVYESGIEEKEGDFMDRIAADDVGYQGALENGLDHSQSLGSIGEEAKQYIQYLEQKVASVTKELEECKHINTGLQVQSMVGEEKNDLLDYLRGLSPDKVAELSQPTSPEVEDVIQQVINRLIDSPLTKLRRMGPLSGNGAASTFKGSWEEESSQKFSMFPLQSQSTFNVNRDQVARLLFWCMLLGHYTRGLEYRLELTRTLGLDSGGIERIQDG